MLTDSKRRESPELSRTMGTVTGCGADRNKKMLEIKIPVIATTKEYGKGRGYVTKTRSVLHSEKKIGGSLGEEMLLLPNSITTEA